MVVGAVACAGSVVPADSAANIPAVAIVESSAKEPEPFELAFPAEPTPTGTSTRWDTGGYERLFHCCSQPCNTTPRWHKKGVLESSSNTPFYLEASNNSSPSWQWFLVVECSSPRFVIPVGGTGSTSEDASVPHRQPIVTAIAIPNVQTSSRWTLFCRLLPSFYRFIMRQTPPSPAEKRDLTSPPMTSVETILPSRYSALMAQNPILAEHFLYRYG